MAALLTPPQREEICAYSRAHPGMTQLAVADWAKHTFSLPTAPSQSFVSTLLRRSREGSALPAQGHVPVTTSPTTTAQARVIATAAANAKGVAFEAGAAQRAHYPALSDEMLRWVLTCDQPATSAGRVKQEGGVNSVNEERLACTYGNVRAPRPDDNTWKRERERQREYQYERWLELREARWYWDESEAASMDDGSEFDSNCDYDAIAYRYGDVSDGPGTAERQRHLRRNSPRYLRWLELREIRRDIMGSNAASIEAESEFDSEYDYEANADRYMPDYGYETETNEDETGSDGDEQETNEEETGDEDGELDSFDDEYPEPTLSSANDTLILKLADVLKRGRDAIMMEEKKEPLTKVAAVTDVKPQQVASGRRLQLPPPRDPSVASAMPVDIKLENTSQLQLQSSNTVIPTAAGVKLENSDPNVVGNLAQTLKSTNEQAMRNRALQQLEGVRCENSLKRIRGAEESLLTRKRQCDAGVPQSEVDSKMPSPVCIAPLRKLLPKPVVDAV